MKELYTHRLFTMEQIRRLLQDKHGGQYDVWKRRLFLLFQNRYVERPQRQAALFFERGNWSTVYGLAERGAKKLDEERGLARGGINWRWKQQKGAYTHIAHRLDTASS